MIAWDGAGQLFFTRGESPVGSNRSKLQSSLLTITFKDEDAGEISVSNLTGDPFIITLSLDGQAELNESASCVHWNSTSSSWVTDGHLISRTNDTLQCAFNHLTSFGGFVGPMNDLASVEDVFSLDSWAQNLLGLVVVLVLCCLTTTIHVDSLRVGFPN